MLAIVKKMKAPPQIAIQIEGSPCSTTGRPVVIFATVFAVAFGGVEPTFTSVAGLFLHEALGGILFGAVLGLIAHVMISATDDGSLELLLTLCIPTAGFAFANMIGVSGAPGHGGDRHHDRQLDPSQRFLRAEQPPPGSLLGVDGPVPQRPCCSC